MNKVAIAGVEVSFFDGRRDSRASITDNNAITSTPNSLLPPGTSGGLGALTGLADLIQRDCQYISMAMSSHAEDCDAKDADTAFQPMECANRPLSPRCIQFEQRAAQRSAQKLLVDYGKCLSIAFDNGTDATFVKQRLEGIAPRLREMTNPKFEVDDDFKERATITFFNETLALVGHIYPSFLAGATLPFDTKTTEYKVLETCRPSFSLLCDGTDTDKNIISCGKMATNFSSLSRNQLEYDELKKSREDQFKRYLNEFLTIKYSDQRPYIITANAYIMTHLRDYESALSKLYDWINTHNYDNKNNLSRYHSNRIYRIRAKTTLLSSTEEWLRYLKSDAPASLREYHLQNISSLIDDQNNTKIYRDIIDISKPDNRRSIDSKFLTANENKQACPFSENYKSRILYNFFAQKLLFAYNALRHPDYETEHAPKARAYVQDVVSADLSCILQDPYGTWGRAILNADALDLHAQILMRDALKTRKSKGKEPTLHELGVALNAAKLGTALVAASMKADREAKANSPSFIEKISITPTYDTHTSLARTISTIAQAIEDVSEKD